MITSCKELTTSYNDSTTAYNKVVRTHKGLTITCNAFTTLNINTLSPYIMILTYHYKKLVLHIINLSTKP